MKLAASPIVLSSLNVGSGLLMQICSMNSSMKSPQSQSLSCWGHFELYLASMVEGGGLNLDAWGICSRRFAIIVPLRGPISSLEVVHVFRV